MMNAVHTAIAVLAATLTTLVAGCSNPNELLGGNRIRGGEKGAVSPEALVCGAKTAGRSYTLFDGTKLEAQRVDEGNGINRARFKPFAVMAGEYQRVLGVVPKTLDTASAAFGEAPPRWHADSSLSGVSLNAAFSVSFDGCSMHTASGPTFASAPDERSAATFCTATMRKAWSRSPSPEEVSACVDLATKKLEAETDPRRRWSYVCASILSSSHFLTF